METEANELFAQKDPKAPFTWREIKEIVNQLDEQHLDKKVYWWGEDEGGVIQGVEILAEDYLFDGDEGCTPRSVLEKATDEFENDPEQFNDDYYVVHTKGTPIMYNY